MGDVSALYPQPQSSGGILAGDPLRVIGALGQINALKAFQAQQAQGQIFQQAIDPNTGEVNANAFAQGLRSNPAAAIGATEAYGNAAVARQRQIDANKAQFDLAASQQGAVGDVASSWANDPNITRDKIRSDVTTLARGNTIPSSVYTSVLATMPNTDNPAALNSWAKQWQRLRAGAGTTIQPAPGAPSSSGAGTTTTVGGLQAGGPTVTGNPPGTPESAALMQSDLARAGNFAQEIFPWQRSLELLKQLGPGGTGPGTQGRQQIESFINALSPTIAQWLPGIDVSKIKNYDELNKYLTQATQQRAAGFGANTDMQLATAISGSPNVHINDLAATDVVKAAIALRRMEQAQIMESAKSGPVGYSGAKAAWPVNQDPRAYLIDMMTKEQRDALRSTMKGPEKDKFNRSVGSAIDNNLITPPGANNGQQ